MLTLGLVVSLTFNVELGSIIKISTTIRLRLENRVRVTILYNKVKVNIRTTIG